MLYEIEMHNKVRIICVGFCSTQVYDMPIDYIKRIL